MKKTETNRVGHHLTEARERGLIPWAWIVDETREAEHVTDDGRCRCGFERE